jgi:hypothetical protein
MLPQQRHTGMDCRYPDDMDVIFTKLAGHRGSGNPCRNGKPPALAEAACYQVDAAQRVRLPPMIRLSQPDLHHKNN